MSACQGCAEVGREGRAEDGAPGSIHNILQIEFDLDRPRGRVRPAENGGRVHSKSYWSVRRAGRREGVGRVGRPLTGGRLLRGRRREGLGLERRWRGGSTKHGEVMEWGEETAVVSVYHLQSGGHSPLPVIIFKRLHPQSVSIMVGLFGHSQFYSLIWALQMSTCVSMCVGVCSCRCVQAQWSDNLASYASFEVKTQHFGW